MFYRRRHPVLLIANPQASNNIENDFEELCSLTRRDWKLKNFVEIPDEIRLK